MLFEGNFLHLLYRVLLFLIVQLRATLKDLSHFASLKLRFSRRVAGISVTFRIQIVRNFLFFIDKNDICAWIVVTLNCCNWFSFCPWDVPLGMVLWITKFQNGAHMCRNPSQFSSNVVSAFPVTQISTTDFRLTILRVLLVYEIGTRLFPWAHSFKNFQQFSESIDTVNWYQANTLLPTLRHVNKCGKSDNNMIWGFLLMTYNCLVIAVRFTIQGWEKETFKWYLGWSPWVLQAKIHSPQHM